jgi:hypothetical protein
LRRYALPRSVFVAAMLPQALLTDECQCSHVSGRRCFSLSVERIVVRPEFADLLICLPRDHCVSGKLAAWQWRGGDVNQISTLEDVVNAQVPSGSLGRKTSVSRMDIARM